MPVRKKLYYVKTGLGCGIRIGTSEEQVEEEVLREVGTRAGVELVEEANEASINWVRMMGGRVPELL